jgi:hypothetical protein
MPSAISAAAMIDVRRVLDAAARRLLAERLALDPENTTSPASNPDSSQTSGRHSRYAQAY